MATKHWLPRSLKLGAERSEQARSLQGEWPALTLDEMVRLDRLKHVLLESGCCDGRLADAARRLLDDLAEDAKLCFCADGIACRAHDVEIVATFAIAAAAQVARLTAALRELMLGGTHDGPCSNEGFEQDDACETHLATHARRLAVARAALVSPQ